MFIKKLEMKLPPGWCFMISKKPAVYIMAEDIRKAIDDKMDEDFLGPIVEEVAAEAGKMFQKKSEMMGDQNVLKGAKGMEFCNMLEEWMESKKMAVSIAATRIMRQELVNAYGRCDIDLIDKIEPILVVHDL